MSVLDAQGALAQSAPMSPFVVEPVRWTTPSAPIVVVLRVLVAVGIVLGLVALASKPTERPTTDLLKGITAGDVTSVTIERWDPATENAGSLRVGWTQDGRPATSTYSYSNVPGTPQVDRGETIIRAASKAGVPVTSVSSYPTPTGINFPIGLWGAAATLAALLLLIAGGEPRLATRWGWFWLVAAVPPAWFVFLALEPLPVWATRPAVAPRTRLSGGWAFAVTLLVLRPILQTVLGPQWGFLLGR